MRDARDRLGRGMTQCIHDCRDCQDSCARTVQHCLRKGGMHAEVRHIRLLSDCAEICQTAGNFMSRSSDHHPAVCSLCAAICEACAESCERIESGDDEMKSCAAACRRCAQSCREMSTSS
jgi:hypothetical protein